MHRTTRYIIGFFIGLIGWLLTMDAAAAGDAHGTAHNAMIKEQPAKARQAIAQPAKGADQGSPAQTSGAADSDSEGAVAVKPSGAKAQKTATPVDPNRRWIMKQKDYRGQRIKPKKPIPLKWEGANQQRQCQAYNEILAQSFDKARFYSIQGDRCKTAQYGRVFLKTARASRGTCPDNFLESNGYTPLMVRNMEQLEALGQESCLGDKRPRPSGSEVKKAAAAESDSKH